MGVINKLVGVRTPNQNPNELSALELEFILNCMKSVAITGEQVETFYNMIIKLQNQYTEQIANQDK